MNREEEIRQENKRKIKEWVVKTASVTKPQKKQWSVSVTLGCYDYNEFGDTIERAYNKLTERIWDSSYLYGKFVTQVLLKYKPK